MREVTPRTIVAVIGVALGTGAWIRPAAADPAGYDCGVNGTPDRLHGRCICPPGKRSDVRLDPHTEVFNGVCVAAAATTLAPPQIIAPVDGVEGVDGSTEFVVRAPAWADAVQIEICVDAACRRGRIRIFDEPASPAGIRFRIEDLPAGKRLNLRVRGRAGSDTRGPPATRAFRVAEARPGPAPVPWTLDEELASAEEARSTTAPAEPGPAARDEVPAVAPPPDTASARSSPTAPSSTPAPFSSVDRARPPSRGALTMRRKVAVGLAAGGVAAVVTAVVLHEMSAHRERDAYALCPDVRRGCDDADRANELLERAGRLELGAQASAGIAGAAFTVASILWLTGAPADPPIAIVPAVSPYQVLVSVQRRF
jgi:hypothetical protein